MSKILNMKVKLSSIFSIFFRLLVIFFVIFIWIRYFVESLILSVFLSVGATFLIDFFIHFILNKKKYISNLKNEEIIKIEQIKNTFILWQESKTTTFFLKMFQNEFDVKKESKFLILKKEEQTIAIKTQFMYRNFCVDDLIDFVSKTKKYNPSKLIICSSEFDKDCFSISKNFDIEIILLDAEQTYINFLKKYDCFPSPLVKFNIPNTGTTFKSLFSNAISRSKTKGYLFASVLLLLSSFIIKFNFYYAIMSSLLLILSVISFFSPKFKHPMQTNIL